MTSLTKAVSPFKGRLTRLRPENTSMFLCDVQQKFSGVIYGFEHVVATSSKLLRAADMFNVGVVVTEQNPKGLGNTVPELNALIKENTLKIKCGKSLFSMVVPEVEQYLKGSKIENVVIFGIESHVCVTQTVLDLLERDINVYVLADGVSSVNSAEIPVALDRLRHAGAFITTSESLLFQLQRDAGLDNFKAFSNMIKEFKEPTRAALDFLVGGGKSIQGSRM